jgi:uncharacterized membrane protein
MKIPRKEWLQCLILAAPFCAGAWLWDKLPERMPIHWGINGQVDGCSSKPVAALLLPCINLAVALLMVILPRLDPKFVRYDEETQASLRRTFSAMRLAVTLFLSITALGILATPLYPAFRTMQMIVPGSGILLIVFGNLMTKLRPNWFFGIRTPWTLESREVWIKTHRLGGKLMVAGGGCLFVFGCLLPMRQFIIWVVFPTVAVMSLVPIVYSYIVCARSRPK